jgi:uncharacterized integral membrane protein
MGEQVSRADEASIRRRQTARLAAIAIVVAAAAALAIDNRDSVRLGYVVGERQAPLVIALVVAFVVGAGVGWLSSRSGRPRG